MMINISKLKTNAVFFYGNKFILFVALGTKLAQFLFLQKNLFISKSLIIHSQSPYKNHKVPKQ